MAVLLATLRGPGVYGDQLDASYGEGSSVAGNFIVPPIYQALADYGATPGTVLFVRFFARVGWYTSGFGPLDAQCWIVWFVGSTATVEGTELPPGGVGVFTNIQSPDYANSPDSGAPWLPEELDDLRMRVVFRADDNGSGETTFGQVAELWAEVWGDDPPPPPPPEPEPLPYVETKITQARPLSLPGEIVVPLEVVTTHDDGRLGADLVVALDVLTTTAPMVVKRAPLEGG